MAREVFQLKDGNDHPTKYVGLTDDGETMRIYVGHFFSYAGRDYGTYEKELLWAGRIEDFSQDLIDQLDAGKVFGTTLEPQPAKVSKVIRRKRG